MVQVCRQNCNLWKFTPWEKVGSVFSSGSWVAQSLASGTFLLSLQAGLDGQDLAWGEGHPRIDLVWHAGNKVTSSLLETTFLYFNFTTHHPSLSGHATKLTVSEPLDSVCMHIKWKERKEHSVGSGQIQLLQCMNPYGRLCHEDLGMFVTRLPSAGSHSLLCLSVNQIWRCVELLFLSTLWYPCELKTTFIAKLPGGV